MSREPANKWKQDAFAILLMFISVIIDGFVTSYWGSTLDTSFGLMIPRTLMLVVIILSFHYKNNFMLISAAVFGFLMDTYYLGFIGVYMASVLLVAYLATNLKQAIHPNVLSYTLVSIIAITMAELVIFGIMKILSITTISFQVFLVSRLGATLLFNGMLMLVFSYFIQQMIIKMMDES